LCYEAILPQKLWWNGRQLPRYCLETFATYCIEGIEMRQRSCKVRRFLFLKHHCPFQHTAAVFILERKEGEIGKQRERPRERVCASVGA
jgi:hypothetical protein